MMKPLSYVLQPSSLSSAFPATIGIARPSSRLAVCAAAVVALGALSGCGASPYSAIAVNNGNIAGMVHGGQQPVSGATVTLYAPGTTGYGSAPTVLATATTNSSGNFTLPSHTCPTNSGNVYLVASGGNPGAGANSVLAEAAELGPCANLTGSTFISISEVTTVAAAYTLAPFTVLVPSTKTTPTATNIGTSATNLLGLNNAFGTANNLVDLGTGNARAASAITGMILPSTTVTTLADILAACINTIGGTASTDACGILFAAATPPGGHTPEDTFQAAINIALYPGNNAATLFSLVTPSGPFQPQLVTGPSDWALGITYRGGNIPNSSGTGGIDIDASGDVWFSVLSSASVTANIAEISPSGSLLSGNSGFANGALTSPQGIAIDNTGNVFIADDFNPGRVFRISSAGTSGHVLQAASLLGPTGIAIDNHNTSTWLTNFINFSGTTVTHMTASGTDDTGSPFSAENVPIGVAIDGTGIIWVANSDQSSTGTGNGFLTRYTASGATYTAQNFATGAGTFPKDIAADSAGSVWVTDIAGVAKFSNSGSQISPAGGFSHNAVTNPASVIVDGLNRAWASNLAVDSSGNPLGIPGSVTVFSSTGTLLSPSVTSTSSGSFLGYTAGGTLPQTPFFPQGIKVDASGNLWVSGTNASTSQTITELVGIAAPAVTPLSVASSTNTLGTRP